jgi:hypothetical protein
VRSGECEGGEGRRKSKTNKLVREEGSGVGGGWMAAV